MEIFKKVFRKRKVFLSGMVPLLFGASSAINAVIIYVLILGMASIQAELPAEFMEQMFQYSFYSIKDIAFMGLSFYVLVQVWVWWPAYVSVFWGRPLKVIGVILGGVWALRVFSSQISEVISDPVILKVLITGVVLGILGTIGERMLEKCQEVPPMEAEEEEKEGSKKNQKELMQ